MDGTRDRPPGKTAENWSRRDGIRAGAVTGPWRSAPRDASAAPRARLAPGSGVMAAETAGGAEPPAAPAAVARAQRAGGWRPGTRAWIALGALVAVAIVAAAVAFRVMQSEEAPSLELPGLEAVAPAMEAPAVPAAAPAPAAKLAAAGPVAAPVDPALAGVTSVRLRIGPDLPAERQAEILAALAAAGITGVQVEPLPFEIATSRVGYYRAADLPAAEALGRVVAPVIAAGGEVGVRDYGELLADAEPGRLDLWVGE